MSGHIFDTTLLRKYDIRGVFGDTLSLDDAVALGRTYGSIIIENGGKFVCLGRDGRLSSPDIMVALASGFMSTGISVVDIGLSATPMLYYASRMLDAPGAIMITGSHNPPNYNGFKLVLANRPFWADQIQQLGERSASGDWVDGQGEKLELDILNAYVSRICSDYRSKRELKVVWDVGNSSVGPAVVEMVRRLPGQHVVLNEMVDGTFPAHHPDPTVPENLTDLINSVTGMGYDLGIAFDGDGDRIGAVDGKGRIAWGDQLLAIYAKELLSRRPGVEVIGDVKASQVLFDEIERLGGVPVMCAPGHSVIKTLMAESGAPLAGEMSGHVFFADGYYGYDDALYAAIRLLDIIAASDLTLSTMLSNLPQMVNTPEVRIEVTEEQKFSIVEEVLLHAKADDLSINEVDGLRVSTADGWWLIRASNTEAALVVRCESENETG
ncbi:MAG: phosphoglucomutase/phosphomannomutase PgmG, partial [Candidatus Latescibacterota bacterium]